MIQLALLRHGHTHWNRAGRIQGRTDIPLDEEAREYLATLRLPAPWRDADVVSSPLARAAETARIVSGRAPVAVPELIEMDWGDWEGAQGEVLLADPQSGYRHIEDWGWSYRPPGGECPQDVLHRIKPWADGLSGPTIAVCHIGIMRVFLARAHGWEFEGPAPFRIKRDRLYLLTLDGGTWQADPEPVRLEAREP
ncbi:MAG: histidine phosphatase family protein [Pseudomonadota bacterium]